MDDAAALALLTDMIETPSVSGEEGPVGELIVERMLAAGFTAAEVDGAGNAVGHLGEGPRHLVLLGHMDTVPGLVPVRREGDLLYGRGAVDAKGPLASFVAGVARAGVREGWRITVVGAVEEEAPSSKGARFVAPLWKPEACVIGEPSGWDAVTLGYKGRLLCDYQRRQGSTHSAGPDPSAGEHAIAFWNAQEALARELNGERSKAFETIGPRLLELQTSHDGLYEEAHMRISWRTPLWFDAAEWEARLRERIGDEESLRFYGHEVAFRGDKRSPLVRAFLPAVRASGGKPRFKVKTGTSDMNILGPVWQCPFVAYGPGDSSLDHTPNEHISVSEFHKGVAVVAAMVEGFTKG